MVEVEDGSLLGLAALKDLQVSGEEGAEEEVPLNIQDLWVVPKRATHDADIGDVYGVGLEEDEDSDNEDEEGRGRHLQRGIPGSLQGTRPPTNLVTLSYKKMSGVCQP